MKSSCRKWSLIREWSYLLTFRTQLMYAHSSRHARHNFKSVCGRKIVVCVGVCIGECVVVCVTVCTTLCVEVCCSLLGYFYFPRRLIPCGQVQTHAGKIVGPRICAYNLEMCVTLWYVFFWIMVFPIVWLCVCPCHGNSGLCHRVRYCQADSVLNYDRSVFIKDLQ